MMCYQRRVKNMQARNYITRVSCCIIRVVRGDTKLTLICGNDVDSALDLANESLTRLIRDLDA